VKVSDPKSLSKVVGWLKGERGMEVTVKANNESVRLMDYDHLLWFGNRMSPACKPAEVIQFVAEAGGNLIWAQAAGVKMDRGVMEMANQFGMRVPAQPTLIQDAFEGHAEEDDGYSMTHLIFLF
jgi:hypothetical protein